MKKIIINKELKFNKDDLMQYVDMAKSFTLKDVFSCIQNSKVPIKSLMKILKCRYLEEYMEEINKTNVEIKKEKPEIKYLEVYRDGETDEYGKHNKLYWSFCGVGKKDKLTDKYAIEYTPLYEMADLEVRVSNVMIGYDLVNKKIIKTKFTPLIMLVELLHAIVWEVAWNGSIENRDARLKELKRRVENLEKEIKYKK